MAILRLPWPRDPGWYVRNDFYYYSAETTTDQNLGPGMVQSDLDLVMAIDLLTILKVTNLTFLGGRYAFGAIPSFAHIDVQANLVLGSTPLHIDDETSSMSDIALVPVGLYWRAGQVHLSFFEYLVAPVGIYDAVQPANAGLNYWSFDSNLAFTYLNPKTGREVSFDLGHIYNTENPDTDYQTGQEIHLDYMLNQFLSETFAIGVHGFHHKQISGDSGKGATLGSYKAEDAGIGPALLWTTKIWGKDVSWVLKWLGEYHAENRLEGSYSFIGFMYQL